MNSRTRKSWVWQYAVRAGDKAYCVLCNDGNNEFSCPGGTTGSLGRHLKNMHKVDNKVLTLPVEKSLYYPNVTIKTENEFDYKDEYPPDEEDSVADSVSIEPSVSGLLAQTRKRPRYVNGIDRNQHVNSDRADLIHDSLAKMIAMNNLTLSFCNNSGFKEFMSVIEPNYNISEDAVDKRLHSFQEIIKNDARNALQMAIDVVCTIGFWSSRCQESYMTLIAHVIDDEWKEKCFTLTTIEIFEDPSKSASTVSQIQKILSDWEIKNKVIVIVSESSVDYPEIDNVTCAAFKLRTIVDNLLQADSAVTSLVEKVNRVVNLFKQSNSTENNAEYDPDHMGMPTDLMHSCKTSWVSVYLLLESLVKNKNSINYHLIDCSTAESSDVIELRIAHHEWDLIETLIKILKPLKIASMLFCSKEASPVSMVRPVVRKMLKNHYKKTSDDNELTVSLKQKISTDLLKLFELASNSSTGPITLEQVASFLDPRFKDLDHELPELRLKIRNFIKQKNGMDAPIDNSNETLSTFNTALEFLYQDDIDQNNRPRTQLDGYLNETQIRFDLNPFDWWKSRELMYPVVASLAKRHLTIPAASSRSNRSLPCACTKSENVDMKIFLQHNLN